MTLTDKCEEVADQRYGQDLDSVRFKVARDCRRHGYEQVIGKVSYCSKPECNCLYRADEPTQSNGLYQCMSIEKKDLWRYQEDVSEL